MNPATTPSPPTTSTDGEDDSVITAPRSSSARSRELGVELRRLRHLAEMSSAYTAEALGWSLGKLSKLETGSRRTSPWEVATLLGHLGADKHTRDRIQTIAEEPDTGIFFRLHDRVPDTLTALIVHERLARTITTYEALTIPALAQTPDYAGALLGDPTLAEVRIARQDPLRRRGCGPETTFYVHEAALRMVVGNPAIMRDQLLHLTLMCGWAEFTPRLIPMTAPFHPATRHPATLLTFDPPLTPVAYVETDTATVFQDHPDAVDRCQAKMRDLASLALPPAQSHEVFARWADRYDRDTR